ncbi:MAG: exo-alpha-sialidase [Verrucomicrobiales bacterium]|nr:exo-alpha-sialidase [Verrucomicrobiales bacterium]
MKNLLAAATLFAVGNFAHGQDPTPLFQAGDNDFGMYRFPGIVLTPSGNLIAFAEGRSDPNMRWSDVRPFIRVSTDQGKTWSDARQFADKPADAEQQKLLVERGVAEEGKIGVHNLTAIADKDGAVHWVYCVEYNRAFYVKTNDKGENATDPVEITDVFNKFKDEVDWKFFGVGPGHGVQLKDTGRLVYSCWISDGSQGVGLQNAAVSTIYSDDGGKTWNRGEIVAKQVGLNTKTGTELEMPSEASIAQAKDGTVILNIRNKALKGQRAQSTGKDGATGWSEVAFVDGLLEPICQGSLTSGGDVVIFANPNNMIMRKSLTAFVSSDNGATYPKKFVLEEGIAGYSDLATDGETVYVIYEKGALGSANDPEAVVFRAFKVSDAK